MCARVVIVIVTPSAAAATIVVAAAAIAALDVVEESLAATAAILSSLSCCSSMCYLGVWVVRLCPVSRQVCPVLSPPRYIGFSTMELERAFCRAAGFP